MKLLKTKVKGKKSEDKLSDLQRIMENLYLLFVTIISVDF